MQGDRRRPFYWGGRNKGCDRAGWLHSVICSYAAAKGLAVASLFADVSKFYERVRHKVLLQEAAAEETHFPLALVVALTQFYGGYRTLSFGKAFSEVVVAAGTIVPGCSCATTMAKVILCRLLVGGQKGLRSGHACECRRRHLAHLGRHRAAGGPRLKDAG